MHQLCHTLNGQVLTADCKSILFGSVSFAVWFSLLCFHSRSNCINMVQQSIQSLFSFASLTESSVLSSASNEETLETAEKTVKPPAIKRQETNNPWVTDFVWYTHTGMETVLTLESLASQCDLCFAERVVPGWRLKW